MTTTIGDIVVINGEPRVVVEAVDGLADHYVTRAIGIAGTDVQYTDTAPLEAAPLEDTEPVATTVA